jgi:hypothetical protein
MMFGRVIPLALVFGVTSAGAADPPVPAIFAVPPAGAAVAATRAPIGVRLPTSDRLRGLIAARVLERAEVFAAPSAPPPTGGDPRTVLMEKFVVESTPLRVTDLRPPDPALWHLVKTGNLIRIHGPKVTAEANLRFFTIEPVGTRPREFTRVELQFGFSW